MENSSNDRHLFFIVIVCNDTSRGSGLYRGLFDKKKYYDQHQKFSLQRVGRKEQFENPVDEVLDTHGIETDDVFAEPTSSNPFGNVLVSDVMLNPDKKPAPPAFNANVNESIIEQTKKMVENHHPSQPDIREKLFKDLGEERKNIL